MKTPTLLLVASVAVVCGFLPASAKPARPSSLTEADLRMCMGFAGADAKVQIATCSKIINSGRVKHPHESEYYAYRAGAYMAIGDAGQALTDLSKAVSIQDKPDFRFQRALAYMAANDLGAAQSDLDQVTRTKADFAPAYFMRGVIKFRLAEFAKAETDFDKAYSLLPSYYQALFARGVSRIKLDNADKGQADVREARGMSSHADDDLRKLGIEAPG
ncbi:MAG: hypothetical protein ABL973_08635 [Micropepsaceae bacterium]